MKKGIHPEYNEITVKSACGSVFTIKSTLKHDINVEVCADSHPFYTGKQRVVDTGGRIDKFNKKFSIPGVKK